MTRIEELAQETGLSVEDARFAPGQLQLTGGTCKVCGCTYAQACLDDLGHACYWVEPDLCSECVGMDKAPRVELYTEGDLNSLLSNRGVV